MQIMPQPFKHPKTHVYYFRKVVPPLLRSALGKGETRISLRTKDIRSNGIEDNSLYFPVEQGTRGETGSLVAASSAILLGARALRRRPPTARRRMSFEASAKKGCR